MPADRRRINDDLRAAERREPGRLGIPLVPTDQRADAPEFGGEYLPAEIAGREVVLLEIEGVVWDMHLAVDPEQGAVGVENYRGIVIDPRGPPLEDRADDDRPGFARQLGKLLARRAGDRFGEIELAGVFALAEVGAEKKLRQADDLSAGRGGRPDLCRGRVQIGVSLRTTAH